MSGFSASWLALREGIDAASRDASLVERLSRVLSARALRALDLGGGTGANVRYLAPRLTGIWTVVDHDRDLLSRVPVFARTLNWI